MTAVEILQRCINVFKQLHIAYVAVGAFSVNAYAEPRSTNDADFVLQLDEKSIAQVMAALGDDFQLDQQMSFETITATSRYKVRHRASRFLIELFLLSDDAHDQARFQRRVEGRAGDTKVFVLTAEDLVVTKLRWSRQGRRPKDRQDLLNVLASQKGKLDLAYVRLWTDQHGTTELLETLLREADEI